MYVHRRPGGRPLLREFFPSMGTEGGLNRELSARDADGFAQQRQ